MSDVIVKRQHTEELPDQGSPDQGNKRRETSRKQSKSGRKPLDTEPKNKRTAQNRAAQRAFRERKEQKMKDLEARLKAMEEDKKNANTEAEFLRLQVQMLMNELAKHRGSKDLSDLNLPAAPETHVASTLDVSPTSDESPSFSSNTNAKSSVSNDSSDHKVPPFSFEFPWSRKSSINTPSSTSSKTPLFNNPSSNSNIPSLSSNSSSTSSTATAASPFELYSINDQKDLPSFKKEKHTGQEFDFDSHFNEGISDFCSELNSACGTKECPVPKSKSQTSTPFYTPPTPTDVLQKEQKDPLYFLNENSNVLNGYSTFDPSLAFDNDNDNNVMNVDDLFDDSVNPIETDPLSNLTTEESLYDPFGLFGNPSVKNLQIVETNPPISTQSVDTTTDPINTTAGKDEDDNEVVPNKEGKYLKCTEIWDRITSHPKYSDIDIDGLCNELRSKAKCSDRGVVIDYLDVNRVIEDSLK